MVVSTGTFLSRGRNRRIVGYKQQEDNSTDDVCYVENICSWNVLGETVVWEIKSTKYCNNTTGWKQEEEINIRVPQKETGKV